MAQSENEIQIYVTTQSHRAGLLFHADGNGNMVHLATASRKKLMGSRAGWPDMCYILDGRLSGKAGVRIVWIELKTVKGVILKSQKDVHALMRGLGCEVCVVKAIDGPDAWRQMKDIFLNG